MKRRDGEDRPAPEREEALEPSDTRGDPAEPPAAEEEPRGLTGVDSEPVKPLTREEIESLRRERDELKDQLLRRRADFENYKKRVDRDRHQAGRESAFSILRALIPIADNLDRALQAGGTEGSLREGVELIRRELLALFESQGVKVEDPAGRKFDPRLHQALSHESHPEVSEGTVLEVLRKGYLFEDRLLRPALVKVSKGPQEDDGEKESPEAVH